MDHVELKSNRLTREHRPDHNSFLGHSANEYHLFLTQVGCAMETKCNACPLKSLEGGLWSRR